MRALLPAASLACLGALVSVPGRVLAQTLTTNDAGERIVVYPDGSWRYFNDPPPSPAGAPEGLPAEEESYTDPLLSAEVEAQARAIVRRRLDDRKKAASRLRRTLDRRMRDQVRADERVVKLRAEGAGREDLREATQRLEEADDIVDELSAELRELEAKTQHLERTVAMTRAQRAAYLLDVGLEAQAPKPPEPPATAVAEDRGAAGERHRDDRGGPQPAAEYRVYDRARDPRLTPPTPECVFAYDGVDEFSKERRRDLAAETFFAYTSDDLRRSLGEDDLITARGRLVDNGGSLSFAVTYVIRSAYAAREFGALPRGASLSLRLVGGGSVELRNATLAQGEYDPVDKVTRYEARYPIDKAAAKTLSRRYLDQARVTWGTGFEDYPLYDIDYFRRLLACL